MNNLIDDIIEVTDELIILMKQDWENFKKFVKEYKTYIYWIVVLIITMQFTDLMSLGASWDRICKKNAIKQSGGGGNTGIAPATETKAAEPAAGTGETKAAEPAAGTGETKAAAPATGAAAAAGTGETKAGRTFDKNLIKQFASKSPESKDVEQKLGFFKRMKAYVSGPTTGKYGLAGPVFGSIDRITTYLQGLISVFTLVLVILGVVSIPVFIFLVITYTVFKVLVTKFFML